MKIHLVSVGQKMPAWVQSGTEEYLRRMPSDCRVTVCEVPAGQRGKNPDLARIIRQEGDRMLAAIPKGSRVVALDVKGKAWSTETLSSNMEEWMHDGRDIALLIGGPDGLDERCLKIADQRWSLSALTFPHPLVRVIVAEQLYRAHSIIKNHPYHRA